LVSVNEERCFNCGTWNPALWGYAPLLRKLGYDLGFVQIITWGCAFLYLASLLYDVQGIRAGGFMSMLAPSAESLLVFGGTGTVPVFLLDRWWTLLSAAWLHGGALHILFNIMWVRQLGPVTADVYGTSRLVIIYTVASVSGFALSTLMGIQLTIGASAPLFGLFGALVWAGRRTGSTEMGRQALFYAVILFVFGFLMPNVDNYAHLGGFLGGLLASVYLDPLKRETLGNLVTALVCILLTFLSLVASFVLA
jgi:rhomboid protease GluP